MGVRTWTDEQTDTLLKLYRQRLTYAKIAERLGVTPHAVAGKLNRMGYARPGGAPVRWTDDRVNELVRLYESGWTIDRLAYRYGLSPITVRAKVAANAHVAMDDLEAARRKAVNRKALAALWRAYPDGPPKYTSGLGRVVTTYGGVQAPSLDGRAA